MLPRRIATMGHRVAKIPKLGVLVGCETALHRVGERLLGEPSDELIAYAPGVKHEIGGLRQRKADGVARAPMQYAAK
jgi:hypothetical protein